MKIPVLTAAGGAPWEAKLLAELSASELGIDIARRCVDVVDLLAAAAAGLAAAVLIDPHLRRLDAECCDRLAASGIAVIGVVDSESDTEQDGLRSLGIGYFVPATAPAAVIAGVVQAAVQASAAAQRDLHTFSLPAGVGRVQRADHRGDAARAQGLGGTGPGGSDNTGSSGTGSSGTGSSGTGSSGTGRTDTRAVAARGAVVAVWGPTGAPGRSTVAAGVADEIARLGVGCLLIDADVYGGVLAPMLGLLDESPGIAAACRLAQSRRLDAGGLADLSWQVAPNLTVLTGISRADRWPELRPTAVTRVLEVARELSQFVVVDLGFGLETDEELSFDTMAPRRNGATLAVLDDADLVLAVASADPIGIQRIVRGLDELKAAGVSAPVWIVLNQVRKGPLPGEPATELNAALERFAGQSPAALLPYDRPAVDAAMAAGQTLAEVAAHSALRRSLQELASAVSGAQAKPRRRRR